VLCFSVSKYQAFLAGDRPEDIAVYIREGTATDLDALADHGTDVEDGVVLVLDGERGRSALQTAAGIDPMQLAAEARGNEGDVDDDLTGGACPGASTQDGRGHALRFTFAFAEEETDAVEGIYNEGDVMHAYAVCSCGTTYADKWLVDG